MKDLFCSYYTNSNDITSYMVNRLDFQDGDIVLEPSAGEGIFIDEILKTNRSCRIDALDIDNYAISVLYEKYKNNPSVVVRKTDTLLDEQLDAYGEMQLWLKQSDTLLDEQLNLFSSVGGHYTKVIGNPPYGAWQDHQRRNLLKKKYAGQYVKETYSLFMLRCISVLQMGGRLSFIVPDTYLFLNMHTKLREILLNKTKIEEILIFPSKFFPGISFGYSNLSIITLERCEEAVANANIVRIVQGFNSSEELKFALKKDEKIPSNIQICRLKQGNIKQNTQCRFILAEDNKIKMLNDCKQTLGDIADVVTGFYTGNNQKFIRVLSNATKGSKGYQVINPEQIYNNSSINGIEGVDEGYVAYIKSASKRRYLREEDEWFVRWDSKTVQFYCNDRKSRFQNSSFYFKKGVGIPMVKSSAIRAFLMEDRVFDQSIVGIFPKNQEDIYYLLALMNSDIINEFIHIINPTANNSANYIKQIPFVMPPAEIKKDINDLVQNILELLKNNKNEEAGILHDQLSIIISRLYQ